MFDFLNTFAIDKIIFMSMTIIESRQNPKIKDLLKLQKSSERRQRNLFLIEGIRELEKALDFGYEIETIFYNPQILEKDINYFKDKCLNSNFYEISHDVYKHIAYREGSGGIIAIAIPKQHDFNILKIEKNPLFLVIEGIEKPGNIGAIYRTADAVGVDGIIICDPLADIYNPNAIRASIGTVFSVPTVITKSESAIHFLKEKKINIYSTYLEASIPYHTADYKKPTAIIVGTEATGISKDWIKNSQANIIIPMQGAADSLNVSVSAAIVLFEAARQRDFKN